jgi:hypothetical protein
MVFQIQSDGTGYTLLYDFSGGASDGRYPYGSLIQSGSTLYGTSAGGSTDGGTIFSLVVPEPASFLLVVIGAAALFSSRGLCCRWTKSGGMRDR